MRILLADDQTAVRWALRLLLEQEPGYTISGEVQDASGLTAAIEHSPPDIVLLDWELPGLESERLLPLANGEGAAIQIIAMSSRPESHAEALSAGVDACISKGKPAEEVLAAIHKVAGERFSPE